MKGINCIIIGIILFLINAVDVNSVVISSVNDFRNNTCEGLTFIIKNEIDLDGSTLLLPAKSVLYFKKGCLINGVIIGNNTRIKSKKGRSIFRNCIVRGLWSVKYAYSTMFDEDLDAITLLHNLSVLSPHIRLSDNRNYKIDGNGEELYVESITSMGNSKPMLTFHTTNPDIEGLILNGNNVLIKGISISDDYTPSNDLIYGVNNVTIGNLIYVRSNRRIVESLCIEDCDFSGGTSSSYVASAQTKNCLVNGCTFSGYLGDHAVYCSMKAESFTIKNCIIRDIVHTKGLFKIRSSNNAQLFMMDDVHAHNLNGYMAIVSLLETPDCELIINDVIVTKDTDNNSVFYGFCLNDETGSISGIGYNANRLVIRDCFFEYGYNGNALVYSGAGKRASIETINYYNCKVYQSDFSGCISRFLNVCNCEFVDCCNINKKGMALMTGSLYVDNTLISDKDEVINNCLFLVNYTDNLIESIRLKNTIVDAKVSHLFDVIKGNRLLIEMNNCTIAFLNRENVIGIPQKCKVDYIESRCKFHD